MQKVRPDPFGSLHQQGVERKVTDPFKVETIAAKWSDLPESIRDWSPGDWWGDHVHSSGDHRQNQRLPGGYHLTVDGNDPQVHLHYDAYDPLQGPVQTLEHWYYEVRRLNNGSLKELPPVTANPMWPPYH
jgi:hypothetical protein